MCEEGFFTEWKQGNTPNKKPRNPAFGGVFFLLVHTEVRAVRLCSSTMLSSLTSECCGLTTLQPTLPWQRVLFGIGH